jgi:hypothetical protein
VEVGSLRVRGWESFHGHQTSRGMIGWATGPAAVGVWVEWWATMVCGGGGDGGGRLGQVVGGG